MQSRPGASGVTLLGAVMAAALIGGGADRVFVRRTGQAPAAHPPSQPKTAVAAPLAQLGLYLDAFHRRDGHPGDQMRAIHYCAQRTVDLIQCALFDGTGADAKLIGIEYVVSESALAKVPEQERALWHSHVYEVTSGQLVAPGLSSADEHALMEKVAHTYGKTWHTWDTTQPLPLGRPALMMAFTADGQARPGLVDARDRELGVSAAEIRSRRANIHPPALLPGVDRGEEGLSCAGPSGECR